MLFGITTGIAFWLFVGEKKLFFIAYWISTYRVFVIFAVKTEMKLPRTGHNYELTCVPDARN